jgi:Flp pilus assembly protein TadB
VAPRSRGLTARIRDQIGFSLVAVLVLFIVLRLLGVRNTVAGFFFSVLLTIGLNVGLSYFYEYRARRGKG